MGEKKVTNQESAFFVFEDKQSWNELQSKLQNSVNQLLGYTETLIYNEKDFVIKDKMRKSADDFHNLTIEFRNLIAKVKRTDESEIGGFPYPDQRGKK